jgi:hypothetical protein
MQPLSHPQIELHAIIAGAAQGAHPIYFSATWLCCRADTTGSARVHCADWVPRCVTHKCGSKLSVGIRLCLGISTFFCQRANQTLIYLHLLTCRGGGVEQAVAHGTGQAGANTHAKKHRRQTDCIRPTAPDVMRHRLPPGGERPRRLLPLDVRCRILRHGGDPIQHGAAPPERPLAQHKRDVAIDRHPPDDAVR